MPTRVIAVAMPWSTAKLMLCKLSCPCSQVFVLAMVALRPSRPLTCTLIAPMPGSASTEDRKKRSIRGQVTPDSSALAT
eukprot:CAMPEP_0202340470 /NCGR_PEP_ID=MMETSP1126-20121109/1898_1 /ASSEMBLY_ACC=CAM_ASM_000457 /TAXON_ID=3047 /ORGANISM="Dunaliella tertiolecta, Strain CCMP1320" /LENGTH=78 /DNA_ID=CAMNT_0048931185 /DNA_START=526 /DNA_END=762 /DNA_ORIENTATION=+